MSSLSFNETGSSPTLTQAENLPTFKNITITNVKKLEQLSHLRYWQNVIRVALDCRGLGSLISSNLPRPSPDHSRYDDWYKWSTLVGKWLLQNIQGQFAEPLQAVRPELVFADETYTAITQMNTRSGEDHVSNELTKLWAMRRDQYSTIGSYVEAWREQVITCFHLDIGLSWYVATKLMLMELKDEIPVMCNIINHRILDKEGNARLMDMHQFNAITNDILESIYKGAWSGR